MKFSTANSIKENELKNKDPDDLNTKQSHYNRLKHRFDNILRAPVGMHRSHCKYPPISQKFRNSNKNRLDHMMKIFLNSGFPEDHSNTDNFDSKNDHPFWTKSQKRILNKQVAESQSTSAIDKYSHLGLKKLDLSKLRQDFLPENRMKKIFEDERIVKVST